MSSQSEIVVFVEVVDRGSFTAAADSLSMSKAAVSKQVGQLETRLAARLLNRTTRRLSLTEAGAALYSRVSGAIADIAAAEAEVAEMSGNPRGRLRVTAPAYFGNEFLMPIVSRFLSQYPDIELELDFDNRLVNLVEEQIDIAIRITTLMDSSLVARRLADVRLFTIASPAYLKKHGKPQQPEELREHVALCYTLDRTPNDWHFLADGNRPISVAIKGNLRCNSDDAIKQAALDGVGIGRFPELFVFREIKSGRLVRLLDDYELPPATLCAVFPTRANLPLKVRAFVDFLAEHLRPAKSSPTPPLHDAVGG